MSVRFEEVSSNLLKLRQLSPDQMGAWDKFTSLYQKEEVLSYRHKELTAIALAVNIRCEWCIATHVKNAIQSGATNQEIIEAAWIAVLMGGGPTLMYAQRVLQALDEFQDISDEELVIRSQAQLSILDEYKKLYWHLIDYVRHTCNEVEKLVNNSDARWKLAHNIAENDSKILTRLVTKEIERKGWA
ncbi:MAG: carboxymuconolactone decarboxylase family protein [Candidatus Bathyarchaeota archaeon]|nr:carboxymuconolactone decarboxylase family protein [Candidatus Bathyarchaeota archaeon]